jgi:predicted ATP-grasp superfamily ATP-dependent carboligase
VLVLDAEGRQALAAVRTYGRQGLAVGAVACESQQRVALAQRSRWSRLAPVVPDFSEAPDAYIAAVLALIDRHRIDVVVPSHDGSIEALRARRADVERRTALALASNRALDLAIDKRRTMALATQLGVAVPMGFEVRDESDLRAALAEIGYPAVMKPVWSWVAGDGAAGRRLSCEPLLTLDDGLRVLDLFQEAGGRGLVQPWLPGRRDAVTLMYANGSVRARFAQTSYRELPVLGGASVLYESIPPLPDIVEPAERLVQAMDLEGVSMVEFRRDREGVPQLMEVNPRMGGSVALAMAAGIDFPRLLRMWAVGLTVPETWHYAVGVRQRWLAGDVESLKGVLKGGRGFDVPSRPRALATFAADFILRPAAFDVFDLRDAAPGVVEFREIMRAGMESLAKVPSYLGIGRAATRFKR